MGGDGGGWVGGDGWVGSDGWVGGDGGGWVGDDGGWVVVGWVVVGWVVMVVAGRVMMVTGWWLKSGGESGGEEQLRLKDEAVVETRIYSW